MKAEPDIRLLTAAIAARNALRGEILPACEQLSRTIGGNPEAERIVRRIHAAAWKHADALRFAMKDRAPVRPSRVSQDLPCWTR
jgi:hypothetical protein